MLSKSILLAKAKQNQDLEIQMLAVKGTKNIFERFFKNLKIFRFRRNIGPSPLSLGDFSDPWDLQDLLQLNQHFDLTYYYTSLIQNNFVPQKSYLHPLFF